MREWGQEIVHKICLTNLSTSVCFDKLVIEAIYFIIIFDASVFPAPLSPKFKKNKKNYTNVDDQNQKNQNEI